MKRQDDNGDDADQDDRWNRTGGSNFSYVPSFGGTGTLNNTFSGMSKFSFINQRVIIIA
jgi:hypothetical protein